MLADLKYCPWQPPPADPDATADARRAARAKDRFLSRADDYADFRRMLAAYRTSPHVSKRIAATSTTTL